MSCYDVIIIVANEKAGGDFVEFSSVDYCSYFFI